MSSTSRWTQMFAGAALVWAVAAPGAVTAQSVTLSAGLSGLQEVPPRSTPATGFGMLTYDAGLGTITVSLDVSGLLGLTSPVGPGGAPAHVHLAPPGVNGPIVLPLLGVPIGVTSFSYDNTFTFAGLAAALPAGFAPNLASLNTALTGLLGAPTGTPANLYFNVHTGPNPATGFNGFPGGEIRGNLVVGVVPEPSTYVLMATGLLTIGGISWRRRRA